MVNEVSREVPQGLRPLGFLPWDFPRDSIHYDTPLAFPHIVPFFIFPSHYIGLNTVNVCKSRGGIFTSSVGVHIEDLIMLYSLHIQSVKEYCSTAFHSSLSQILSNKLEAIQKTCLIVIWGEMFIDYSSAIEMCSIKSLLDRRENRSLSFAIKCTKHKTNMSMFPLNPSQDTHTVRHREKFLVNKSHTTKYMKSTIPYFAAAAKQKS